jgi:hypothetical protein
MPVVDVAVVEFESVVLDPVVESVVLAVLVAEALAESASPVASWLGSLPPQPTPRATESKDARKMVVRLIRGDGVHDLTPSSASPTRIGRRNAQ